MTFRSESARYLITLITPARTELPEVYQRNTDDFGTVIRSLTVR